MVVNILVVGEKQLCFDLPNIVIRVFFIILLSLDEYNGNKTFLKELPSLEPRPLV